MAQMLAIASMVGIGDYSGSILVPVLLASRRTFVELTLQLSEIALLDTNLQRKHLVFGRTALLRPSLGDEVRFLDRVTRTCDWHSKCCLRKHGGRKQD
jgi:hypothetical protein